MTQGVDEDIDQRIEIGLETGGHDVDIVAVAERRPGIVLMVVLPIPIDILAHQQRIQHPGSHRADDDRNIEPQAVLLFRHRRSLPFAGSSSKVGPNTFINLGLYRYEKRYSTCD